MTIVLTNPVTTSFAAGLFRNMASQILIKVIVNSHINDQRASLFLNIFIIISVMIFGRVAPFIS
jgi:hypothetical protein